MAFSLLGNLRIGDATWTGPTVMSDTRKASLPEHEVARGKPVVQDTGDDLDRRSLEFFFDETFCDPASEKAKLEAAFAGRTPLAYVGGDGAFSGVRWLIEEFDCDTLTTTPGGRAVRIKIKAKMKEAPIPSMLGLLTRIAQSAAAGLAGAVNLGAKK